MSTPQVPLTHDAASPPVPLSVVIREKTKVSRLPRSSIVGLGVLAAILAVAPLAPYTLDRGVQGTLTMLFALVIMATMWNLLAGYGGMLSVGQQAYVGIGAYGLVMLSDTVGLDPFMAVPLAVVIAGVISVPISFLAFRLSGGYFAIGTWVIAEVIKLVFQQIPALGGGIGLTFHGFSSLNAGRRIAYVYWLSLGGMVLVIVGTYLLMRSRLGLGFTALRDDPVAAASLGVDVTRSKRIVFVVSAMGCALAGAIVAANTLRVQPDAMFSLNYAVFMIFMVVIGGIGSIEGPILGAILFVVLQQVLADQGAWYLVLLGVLALVVTLFLPGGLWGLISRNGRFRLFPVGYQLKNVRPAPTGVQRDEAGGVQQP